MVELSSDETVEQDYDLQWAVRCVNQLEGAAWQQDSGKTILSRIC